MRVSNWVVRPVVKRAIWCCSGLLLLTVVGLVLFRGVILRSYIEDKIEELEQRFAIAINYSTLKFEGLSAISIEGLSVVPVRMDTLLSAQKIAIGIKPLKLLLGKVDIKYLECNRLHVSFIKSDSLSNYDFIYPQADSLAQADSTVQFDYTKLNYSRETRNILSAFFSLLPGSASLTDVELGYRHNDYFLRISLPKLNVKDDAFFSEINVEEPQYTDTWIALGEIHDADRELKLKLYSKNKSHITLPFLPHRWSAEVTFDTLMLNLSQQPLSGGATSLNGLASVSGLAFFHESVSPERVQLDKGLFDYKINIGNNFIELDSATTVGFNRLIFNPYMLAQRNSEWHFRVSVNKHSFDADDLFSSLPRGLFANLEGLQCEGKLSYHMLFDVDLAMVDSLKLESRLKREGFKIKNFGATDLRRMNSPFTYTAYDNGVAVRSFELGAANADFRPLNAISPLLQMAVMQSEDGAFFNHNGFLIDCMRDAIIEDIKQRRFARGGSTISMQLVKNVFLSRHKTIARKVEEALIVWLIEGNRLTSKERMFEVYMNIIEWGPGVYGANEAARYYFDKQASDLNLNESIFLAGIVPSPKRALGAFTDSLTLRPYMEGYFRVLAQRFVVKGLISQQEADLVRAEVKLKGAAREALLERSNRIELADTTSLGLADYVDYPIMPVEIPKP